jgi:phage terminase Nu1 subunit (DNA packaging protein)
MKTSTKLTTGGLAQLIGVSPRTIRDLAERGVIKRDGRDFPMPKSVQSYCEHLRRAAHGKRGDGAASATASEKTRLVKLQADAMEAKNRLASGRLLDSAEVLAGWSEILRRVRAAVLAAPSRCAARRPHWDVADVAALDDELRRVLTELGTSADA